MEPVSLSYQTIKCLLPLIEANRRFHICNRVPFIRGLEKTVPFEVDQLVIHGTDIYGKCTINNITYRFGVVKIVPKVGYPESLLQDNREGGAEEDSSVRELKDNLSKLKISAGDVNRNNTSKVVNSKVPTEKFCVAITNGKTTVLRLFNIKDGTTSLKYFNKLVFGQRRTPVKVHQLEVTDGSRLPFPKNLKLYINILKLCIGTTQNFKRLEFFIKKSCFPLSSQEIRVLHEREILQRKIVAKINKFVLSSHHTTQRWHPFLAELPNPEIFIRNIEKNCSETFTRFISYWILSSRVPGNYLVLSTMNTSRWMTMISTCKKFYECKKIKGVMTTQLEKAFIPFNVQITNWKTPTEYVIKFLAVNKNVAK